MYTDKWKQEDGCYLDENGCWHETALDLISDWLGFCSCGYHIDALAYIREVLTLVADRTEGSSARREAFFHSPGEESLVYYLLIDKKMVDHRASIPGCLTERGKGVLADLIAILP